MRRRVTLVVVLALGLCAAMLTEVWRWGGGILRLPLPIAHGAGLPVPLISWASIVLYAAWYGRLFRVPTEERWARLMRLGFGLHVLVLIAHLAWYVARGAHGVLLSWYLYYWYAVWAGVFASGMAGLGWWVTRWRQARTADPWLFYIPLVGGYAAVVVSALVMPRGVAAGAVLLGLGLLGGLRTQALPAWGAQVWAWLRRERIFLAGIFVVALAFRLFYSVRILATPDFLNTGSDGPAYDALAWAVLEGKTQPRWGHIALFAPGYVRFLALIYWLVGRNYFVVLAVQSVIGAWACLLAYGVAKRLFGQTVARLTAGFSTLNFPMVFAAAAIGHQALDLFWTLAAVWCLVRYLEEPARWGRWIVGIGLLFGWAAVTREGNLVFAAFLVGWFLFGGAKLGWRRTLTHLAGFLLGFLAVAVPLVKSQSEGSIVGRASGQWFVMTSQWLHTQFNPWRDPVGAWALFKAQPLHVMLKLGEGLVEGFNKIFLHQAYGAFDPVFLVLRSPYYYVMWDYAFALAFIGLGLILWQALRTPTARFGWWLILLLLVSRTLPHLFLEAAYRHRVPFEPYLIMMAAYGLFRLMQVGRERAVQRMGTPAAWGRAPAAVVGRPGATDSSDS